MALINYRLKVTLTDGRALVGQLLAFDAHMNLVLAETDEFRTLKRAARKAHAKKAATAASTAAGTGAAPDSDPDDEELNVPVPEQKRTLGLIILRGEGIVSLQVVAPPPAEKLPPPSMLPAGPGRGVPAGRGMGLVPPAPMGPGGMAPPPGMAGRPVPYGPPPGMMPPAGPPPGMPFPPPSGLPSRPPVGPPPGFAPPGFPQGGFRPGYVFLRSTLSSFALLHSVLGCLQRVYHTLADHGSLSVLRSVLLCVCVNASVLGCDGMSFVH